MRVRMTLQVPLTMPTRASMRLATRPRCKASMMGIPPPQLASKAMHVLCLRARANNSGPRCGQQAFIGGDDRLAEFQRQFDPIPGGRGPPISSSTICTLGSSIAAGPSLLIGKSLLAGRFRGIAHDHMADIEFNPARRCRSSACSVRILTTPPPTTPQPRRQMPMVDSLISANAKAYRVNRKLPGQCKGGAATCKLPGRPSANERPNQSAATMIARDAIFLFLIHWRRVDSWDTLENARTMRPRRQTADRVEGRMQLRSNSEAPTANVEFAKVRRRNGHRNSGGIP